MAPGYLSVIFCWVCQVVELCEAANAKVGYDSVRIANYLCSGNYAVSGGTDGCQAVQDLAKSKGARMTIKLAVAGAFHTAYMQPAQEALQYAPRPYCSCPCAYFVPDCLLSHLPIAQDVCKHATCA